METRYTWMVCICEGHSNVNHEWRINFWAGGLQPHLWWVSVYWFSWPQVHQRPHGTGWQNQNLQLSENLDIALINDSVPNKYLPLTVPLSGTTGLSFCQLQKQRILVSRYINSSSISYIPQCLDSGAFDAVQCDTELGQCWCVDPEGMEIYGTRQRGKPTQCK